MAELAIVGEFPDEDSLLERVREALTRGMKKINIINGFVVECNSSVSVLCGPILGEVTSNSAIVMFEVSGPEQRTPIACNLYKGEDPEATADSMNFEVRVKRPISFTFEGLEPDTEYTVVLNGVAKYYAARRMATFKTKPEHQTTFRLFALSCDRPRRLLLGQQNPWKHMLRRIKGIDCILHLGDQIYPDDEDIADADRMFNKIFDQLSPEKQTKMMLRGRELWRNKYRGIYSMDAKADCMAKVSNLMIWSDNDVANDFTTMKNETGDQAYHPSFLQCGMRTYREYQRRLWDPKCSLQVSEAVEEWHSHVYGPIGIFMFDLRGNRITGEGHQGTTIKHFLNIFCLPFDMNQTIVYSRVVDLTFMQYTQYGL